MGLPGPQLRPDPVRVRVDQVSTVVGTTITEGQAIQIAGAGGAITLMEDAIQNLEAMRLDEDDLAAIRCMPTDWRIRVTGRLIELAESLRESLLELDGAVLGLTGGKRS